MLNFIQSIRYKKKEEEKNYQLNIFENVRKYCDKKNLINGKIYNNAKLGGGLLKY